MSKDIGAFLTIGELSAKLNVPQHILRYWETRFPALRPLQRAGNRRYYRPRDVELACKIHRLLTVDGYTVRGAQQALSGKVAVKSKGAQPEAAETIVSGGDSMLNSAPDSTTGSEMERNEMLGRLMAIRTKLVAALA